MERADSIKLLNQTANACRKRSKYNVKICGTAGCKMIEYCRQVILEELRFLK